MNQGPRSLDKDAAAAQEAEEWRDSPCEHIGSERESIYFLQEIKTLLCRGLHHLEFNIESSCVSRRCRPLSAPAPYWVTDPLSKQPGSLKDTGCAREKPGAGDLPRSKQSSENIHSPNRAPVGQAANTAEATGKATGVDGLWSGLQSSLSSGFEAVSTGNFARHENRGPSGISGN